jgi:hypothetical protein
LPFFSHVSLSEFFLDTRWSPLFEPPRYGILPLLVGTLVTTLIACVFAVPAGIMVALLLSEYVPEHIRKWLKPIIELLAAIPLGCFWILRAARRNPMASDLHPQPPRLQSPQCRPCAWTFDTSLYGLSFGGCSQSRSALTARGLLRTWLEPLQHRLQRRGSVSVFGPELSRNSGDFSRSRRDHGGGHRSRDDAEHEPQPPRTLGDRNSFYRSGQHG